MCEEESILKWSIHRLNLVKPLNTLIKSVYSRCIVLYDGLGASISGPKR